MNVVRYNPNRWFDSVFDRWASDFFSLLPAETAKAETPVIAPRVDVRDKGDKIVLTAEIPGVEREGLKIEVKNGVLTLHGEKRLEESEEGNGFYRSERVYGTFSRSFTLPEEVDGEAIAATYKDGVLAIDLPKKPEAAPKMIAIKESKAAEPEKVGVN